MSSACCALVLHSIPIAEAAMYYYRIDGVITDNTIIGLSMPVGSAFSLHFSYSTDSFSEWIIDNSQRIGCASPVGYIQSGSEQWFSFTAEDIRSIRPIDPGFPAMYGIVVEDPPSAGNFIDTSIEGELNEFDIFWNLEEDYRDLRLGYMPGGESDGRIDLFWNAPSGAARLSGSFSSIAVVPEPSPVLFLLCSALLLHVSCRHRRMWLR